MRRSEMQNNLAMTVALISWGMLFATLLMGYAIYRMNSNVWPPMGFEKISLIIPVLSTAVILVSSLFCYKTKVLISLNKLEDAKRYLNFTLITGVLFLGLQTVLWSHLKSTGVYVSSGIFASIIYAFTWIHAAHVIGGLAALIYLVFQLKNNGKNLFQKILNVEKFWHFLGIIWIVIFLTVFVL